MYGIIVYPLSVSARRPKIRRGWCLYGSLTQCLYGTDVEHCIDKCEINQYKYFYEKIHQNVDSTSTDNNNKESINHVGYEVVEDRLASINGYIRRIIVIRINGEHPGDITCSDNCSFSYSEEGSLVVAIAEPCKRIVITLRYGGIVSKLLVPSSTERYFNNNKLSISTLVTFDSKLKATHVHRRYIIGFENTSLYKLLYNDGMVDYIEGAAFIRPVAGIIVVKVVDRSEDTRRGQLDFRINICAGLCLLHTSYSVTVIRGGVKLPIGHIIDIKHVFDLSKGEPLDSNKIIEKAVVSGLWFGAVTGSKLAELLENISSYILDTGKLRDYASVLHDLL
jgi:hypothetical protein